MLSRQVAPTLPRQLNGLSLEHHVASEDSQSQNSSASHEDRGQGVRGEQGGQLAVAIPATKVGASGVCRVC